MAEIFCSCWKDGVACGTILCPIHIKHAPNGCAVTATDKSDSCPDFRPMYRVLTSDPEGAAAEFKEIKNKDIYCKDSLLNHVVFANLTAAEVEGLCRRLKAEGV